VAAKPTLDRAGYWLMTVTALFATAGATNAGLYPAALVIFTSVTAAHLRIRAETGARLPILILAVVAAGMVFVTFVFTTLIHEPAPIAALLGIFLLSVALDLGWKHFHDTRTKDVRLAH
jgi:predicted tellurium resistance membrane protein TerC